MRSSVTLSVIAALALIICILPTRLSAQVLGDPKPLDLYHLALGVVEVGQPALSQVSSPDLYYLGMTLLSGNANYKASVKDPDVQLILECFLAGKQLYSIDKYKTALGWATSQAVVGADEPKLQEPVYQRYFIDAIRLRNNPAEAKPYIDKLK